MQRNVEISQESTDIRDLSANECDAVSGGIFSKVLGDFARAYVKPKPKYPAQHGGNKEDDGGE